MEQSRRVGRVRADARHVGEEHEFLGPEPLGDRSRHRVGVDVVRLAGTVRADRGDDGHEALGEKVMNDRRVDGENVADVAQLRVAGSRRDEPRVLP